jgi:hypothetical protein
MWDDARLALSLVLLVVFVCTVGRWVFSPWTFVDQDAPLRVKAGWWAKLLAKIIVCIGLSAALNALLHAQ